MAETKDDAAMLDTVEGSASTDDIPTLLEMHRTGIDALRALVQDHIPASGTDGVYLQYDDIFFLRYILSFSSPENAKNAVLKTFEYRAQPKTQAMLKSLLDGTWHNNPKVASIMYYRSLIKYH